MAPSLDARQDMAVVEVPRLGKEASSKAIKEWGQPKLELTHLVFVSTNRMDIPDADYQLCKLLVLRASVKRVMMYNLGCYAGGTVLRVAKDITENNRGARVLAVCSEVTTASFRGTSDTHIDCLVGHAIFADGTTSVIVGACPIPEVEKPCFELLLTTQTTLPDCEGNIDGHTREAGIVYYLKKELAGLISDNVEMALVEAFGQFNISNWNELFWVVHPGGRAILDQVESKLGLDLKKMMASREVLREYGNMWRTSMLFMLDKMRKSSKENGCVTMGEGEEMGVLLGFGPGLTLETVVLKSFPLPP